MSDLVLVKLNEEQRRWARDARPTSKKNITHAVLCGPYGQLFGTEIQCRDKFDLWRIVFKRLFRRAYESDNCVLTDYTSTADLVAILIDEDDCRRKLPIRAKLSGGPKAK